MRITKKDLEKRIEYLNEITGSPLTTYTKQKDGSFRANIGNFHLSQAYGGYSLHRMQNLGGGITEPFGTGHIKAKDLYNAINAFISGLQYKNE